MTNDSEANDQLQWLNIVAKPVLYGFERVETGSYVEGEPCQ